MTKDRARKRAAHERANLTGESYVVARRSLDDGDAVAAARRPMSPAVRTLHEWTHRVPGVPPHSDAGYRTQPDTTATVQPLPGEPRVLVGLQNWISRRTGLPHQGR